MSRLAVELRWPVGGKIRTFLMPAGMSAGAAYKWGIARHPWPDSVFVRPLEDPGTMPRLFSEVTGKDRCP